MLKPTMILRNFRYCTVDVKYMLFRSYSTNMYCCPLWFNSTSSSIKKFKASYNGVLRRLLLIVRPYTVPYTVPVKVCYTWYTTFFRTTLQMYGAHSQ